MFDTISDDLICIPRADARARRPGFVLVAARRPGGARRAASRRPPPLTGAVWPGRRPRARRGVDVAVAASAWLFVVTAACLVAVSAGRPASSPAPPRRSRPGSGAASRSRSSPRASPSRAPAGAALDPSPTSAVAASSTTSRSSARRSRPRRPRTTAPATGAASAPRLSRPPVAPRRVGTVVVRPGDNLWLIAARDARAATRPRPADDTDVARYWRVVIAANRRRCAPATRASSSRARSSRCRLLPRGGVLASGRCQTAAEAPDGPAARRPAALHGPHRRATASPTSTSTPGRDDHVPRVGRAVEPGRALARRQRRRKQDRVALYMDSDHCLHWIVAYAGDPQGRRGDGAGEHAAVDRRGAGDPRATPSRPSIFTQRRLLETRAHRARPRCPIAARSRGDRRDLVATLDAPRLRAEIQVPVDADDMADIMYTSGTTGLPKGVLVRHRNVAMIPNTRAALDERRLAARRAAVHVRGHELHLQPDEDGPHRSVHAEVRRRPLVRRRRARQADDDLPRARDGRAASPRARASRRPISRVRSRCRSAARRSRPRR